MKKYRPRNASHWRWFRGGMIYYRPRPYDDANAMAAAYLKPKRGCYARRDNGGGRCR